MDIDERERNSKLRNMRDIIEKNDVLHHREILRILKKNDCNISSNRNGSFINLSIIDDTILEQVDDYLKHVKNQEIELKAKIDAQDNEKQLFLN
jgi:hypothetical protein